MSNQHPYFGTNFWTKRSIHIEQIENTADNSFQLNSASKSDGIVHRSVSLLVRKMSNPSKHMFIFSTEWFRSMFLFLHFWLQQSAQWLKGTGAPTKGAKAAHTQYAVTYGTSSKTIYSLELNWHSIPHCYYGLVFSTYLPSSFISNEVVSLSSVTLHWL